MKARRRDWRGFSKDFKSIILRDDRARGIGATYYPHGGFGVGGSRPGVVGEWEVTSVTNCQPDADTFAFKRFARRAAVAAGCPDHPDSWVYWLEGIRLADLAPAKAGEMHVSGSDGDRVIPEVKFENICYLSMRYCDFLARNAAPPPFAPQVVDIPLPRPSRDPWAWKTVAIEFTSDLRLQVTVNGQSLPAANYAEAGFEDRRTKTPNVAWRALRTLAEASDDLKGLAGEIKGDILGSRYDKRVQEIRRTLRDYLAREGFVVDRSNPLPCEKGIIRPVFQIGTRPSYRA